MSARCSTSLKAISSSFMVTSGTNCTARWSCTSAWAGYTSRFTRDMASIFARLLVALVFLQAAHQLGARIHFLALFDGRTRQQHARFDLGQHGGHHQVFAGELQLHLLHELDVLHVLARDLGDGDVEDVQVLAADEV